MPPKKIKFKVVKKLPAKEKPAKEKKPKSLGKKLTGLKKKEMNKLKPEELFGKLPKELRKKILDPKETGVKVASKDEVAEASYTNFIRLHNEYVKKDHHPYVIERDIKLGNMAMRPLKPRGFSKNSYRFLEDMVQNLDGTVEVTVTDITDRDYRFILFNPRNKPKDYKLLKYNCDKETLKSIRENIKFNKIDTNIGGLPSVSLVYLKNGP